MFPCIPICGILGLKVYYPLWSEGIFLFLFFCYLFMSSKNFSSFMHTSQSFRSALIATASGCSLSSSNQSYNCLNPLLLRLTSHERPKPLTSFEKPSCAPLSGTRTPFISLANSRSAFWPLSRLALPILYHLLKLFSTCHICPFIRRIFRDRGVYLPIYAVFDIFSLLFSLRLKIIYETFNLFCVYLH